VCSSDLAQVEITLENTDEMVHNWVLCTPGEGVTQKVADAAKAANPDAAAQISHALTSRGHDAVIRTGPARSILEAFLPNPEGRVKSIFNEGTWDRNNLDMIKSIPVAVGAGLLYRSSQQKENK
jgi:hypothetical protein